MLTPNPGLILWTIVTFLALVLVLRTFAWKPLLEEQESPPEEFTNPAGVSRGECDTEKDAERIRAELESPESGIYTPVNKGKFHGREAFLREYAYSSGGKRFFGGGTTTAGAPRPSGAPASTPPAPEAR